MSQNFYPPSSPANVALQDPDITSKQDSESLQTLPSARFDRAMSIILPLSLRSSRFMSASKR